MEKASPSRWRLMPKVAAMQHLVPHTIRQLGGTGVSDTGPFEASHKEIKAALRHTNNKDLTGQVWRCPYVDLVCCSP